MSEDFAEKPEQSVDVQHYLAIARRRTWHFLIPLFAGWLAVWGASWFLPSVYRSGTLILIEQPTVPSQYVVPNMTENLQSRLQSITQQILSRTRLMRIIESQNLYPEARRRLTSDDVVERMRKDVEIELVQDRDQLTAFNVYYSSSDPQVARRVTKELTDLFISENVEARQEQSENTTQFLETHLEEARKSLGGQEEKIREFKDRHLGDLPGQLQSNLQILGGLQGQLGGEQDALDRAKQQNVYLESLLGQYRLVQRSTKGDNATMGLPALEQELERLKARLADLSSHYTDRHPDVRKVKEQIAKAEKMKQQIAEDLKAKASAGAPEESSITGSKSDAEIREMSPMAELESQLKVNRIEIANRERAMEELKQSIADYQARLNREPVREQQLADLTRDYDQSRANYESLLKKRNESELASSLERRQQGEHFRILDPPSLPVKPFSPNRLKLSAIGLFLGLVLGIAVSAGAEVIDDRLYGEKDLKALLPLEVISEIPNISTPGEEVCRRKAATLAWAATGLEFVLILAGFAISYFRG
ncbi:MAG TPA: GNVR domain-containing protein [Terriglobales bacterium]|nr:GNVR domain-containing protein [Terriglobales bacterium]